MNEAFKDISCSNCIYYNKGMYPDDSYCDEGISMDEDFTLLEDDFCCNRHKKIDPRFKAISYIGSGSANRLPTCPKCGSSVDVSGIGCSNTECDNRRDK